MEAYAGKLTGNSLNELAAGQLAPKQPPLGRLFNTLDMMRKAASTVSETTDRLCGSHPTADGTSKEAGLGEGTFSEIQSAADQFQRMAEQIISDMGRISSRL